MFDPRLTLQQQVSEQLKNYFGDKVFNTIIPRNVDSPKRLAMENRGLFTNHLAAEHWLTKLLLMSF